MTPNEFNRQTAQTLIHLASDLLSGKYQASQWEGGDEDSGEFYVRYYRHNPCKFQADIS